MNVIGIAGKENMTACVNPRDYSDDKYECQALMTDQFGNPVLIGVSRSSSPSRYRVIHNKNVLFFIHYKDVVDYCSKHNFKSIKGGR